MKNTPTVKYNKIYTKIQKLRDLLDPPGDPADDVCVRVMNTLDYHTANPVSLTPHKIRSLYTYLGKARERVARDYEARGKRIVVLLEALESLIAAADALTPKTPSA